jgi:catechol 2,3-dioxygenase-like lactoylglutathione lyase family enzyme
MKRMHIHVSVEDLARSVRFYSTLFSAEPTVLKDDYAKWMLEDPRVNFAISERDGAPGVQHLGIQAEDQAELAEIYGPPEPRRAADYRTGGHDLLLCTLG